ncbi:hypothetical protein [Sphingobacterium thalpophilum]|uniref:Uncharacterized protein n=1 Tax=Sphingobacterium thalpophilum TaxID=259 RepID=A0A4V6Z2E7_9SPHI|nr:hypothetical protein [Sphingobacterium thalpophilum]VTR29028.1 Uncharacterised protein [Sphingobacterium thalpophilum]
MKRKIFFTIVLISLFGCNKRELVSDDNISLSGINTIARTNNVLTAPWLGSTDITIYTRNSSLITVPLTVSYPWYSAGNPLAVANPDIQPADGWELVYDDLGNAAKGVDFPFFALYNKYRGILRLFLYNSQRVSANYFRAELYFRESNFSNSILSYIGDEAKSTYATYDPSEKQTVVAYANAFSSWINFDFTLTNYDDRINKNNVLDFKMYSINESNINLSSTEFTLAHELASKAQLGTSSSSFSSALQTGQKYIKTFDDTKKLLKEAGGLSDRPSLLTTIGSIASKSYLNAIPLFGQALGIVSAFIGGKSQPFQWQMLKFNGSLKLEGTFTSTVPVYTLSLSTSNDIPTGSVIRKLNATSFGVFNLKNSPELLVIKDEERWDEGGHPDWPMADRDYMRTTDFKLKNETTDLLLNPTSGLNLISRRVRLVADFDSRSYGEGQYLNESFHDWNSNVVFGSVYSKYDVWDGYSYPMVDPGKLGLELTFRPIGMSDNSKDILFLKLYKIKVIH